MDGKSKTTTATTPRTITADKSVARDLWIARVILEFGLLKTGHFNIVVVQEFDELTKRGAKAVAIPLKNRSRGRRRRRSMAGRRRARVRVDHGDEEEK